LAKENNISRFLADFYKAVINVSVVDVFSFVELLIGKGAVLNFHLAIVPPTEKNIMIF
jgi:hypothetical protein